MFGNLKVATRLALGFGVVVVLLLVISVTSVLRLGAVHQASLTIMDDFYPKSALGDDIVKGALDSGRQVRNVLLSTSPVEADKAWQKLVEVRARNAERMKKLDSLLNTDRGRELFRTAASRDADMDAKYARIAELNKSDKAEAVDYLRTDFAPANDAYMAALEEFSKFQDGEMEKASKHGGEVYEATSTLIVGLSLAAVLSAIGIGFLITRNLQKVLGGEPRTRPK